MSEVSVRAHAKINLDLRVLGAHPGGYHELRTVFQTIALHDTVSCQYRPGPFAIECDTVGMPLDGSNLIWRSSQALWRSVQRTGDVRDVVVRVEKQIPMEAGLGGGSADAAATLVALASLWDVRVPPAQLSMVGATIGADVPFFLAGGTALGLGRGDEIYPLVDLPRHWIVLVIPAFGVSTKDAYGWYDSDRATGVLSRCEPQYVPGPWPSRSAQMVNDLEGPTARRHPEIEQMRAALIRLGAAAAAMSGSGSTVFGLFQRKGDAVRALPGLASSGWNALVTQSLGRSEYERSTRPLVRPAFQNL
jgi:4-diphosphocytidyl-2-C-methyl-D-erythritol kinase